MTLSEMFQPILIEQSKADSRSLIMPHQQEAVDALCEYFDVEMDIPNRNGLLVMPTGSGKTYTAVNWLLSQGVANGYRIVWLVHRQELVEQTYREFRKQAPILNGTGIKKLKVIAVSGAHAPMSTACKADVYVCSIASVANKYGYRFIERMLGAQGKRRVIIVCDEAHHAVSANYQKVIKRITALNPNRILLGLTATPYRMQATEQNRLQKIFNVDYNISNNIGNKGFIYEITLKQLLVSGYLANPIYERINTDIIGEIEYQLTEEDEAFFNRFGELSEKVKNKIAKSSVRNKVILDKYLENKDRYGKTLIFAVNQMHAETLCNDFKAAGIRCDYAVSGRADSQEVINRFKNNEFNVLINVQMLTEGSDVPDIQTVFLTRETNSDSLLMQMIGRGLRGEKAGGTKDAYIVSFHDTWNTFAYWLDPEALDVFDDEIEDKPEPKEELPEIEPFELDPSAIELFERLFNSEVENQENEESNESNNTISERELYLKLYPLMKAALSSSDELPILPCGWYSVIDENGNNFQLLVFDEQINAYKNIGNNISLISKRLDADRLLKYYFEECEAQPDIQALDYLLQYIEDMGEMPPYFEFEMRTAVSPTNIAEKINELFEKDEDKEEYLKRLFDNSQILQQIYKYFFAFKKTVFDSMKLKTEAIIETTDDRKDGYEIVENYFNLNELLSEVLEMYPKLNADNLVKVAWSNDLISRYEAVCVYFEETNEYQIYVNKKFSSPSVENGREVVKYLLFHELLHKNGYDDHDDRFRSREWQYPNSAELDGIIDSIMLEYNFDDFEFKPSEHYESINTQEKNDTNKMPSGVENGFKYCRNCGNKLPQSANFCDKCGQRIDY